MKASDFIVPGYPDGPQEITGFAVEPIVGRIGNQGWRGRFSLHSSLAADKVVAWLEEKYFSTKHTEASAIVADGYRYDGVAAKYVGGAEFTFMASGREIT